MGFLPLALAPPEFSKYTVERIIWPKSGPTEENAMIELLGFISYIVRLYEWVIIATVIFSWLVQFNVIYWNNDFVRTLGQALNALTEPLLRPIRRVMPNLGGLDLSPIVLLLGCLFVRSVVLPNIAKAVIG